VFHLGPQTTEFSWVPGYAWEMCHCGRCAAHLGWRYQATSPRALAEFWGLRRSQITES
jgi:cereblon